MTEITLRYTTKTSSPSLQDALEICENLENSQRKGDFIYVTFQETDEKLEKLIELTSRWKTTKIYVDGYEYKPKIVKDTLFCKDRLFCEGKCTHPKVGWMKLSDYEARFDTYFTENNGNTYANEKYFTRSFGEFTSFLIKENEKCYSFNKGKISEMILKNHSFELNHCPIIDKEKTLGLAEIFPENVHLVGWQELNALESGRNIRNDLNDNKVEYNLDPPARDYRMKQFAKIVVDDIEKRLPKWTKIINKVKSEKTIPKKKDKKKISQKETIFHLIEALARQDKRKEFTRREFLNTYHEMLAKMWPNQKTPSQTVSRILQELRDEGKIEFVDKGTYRVC